MSDNTTPLTDADFTAAANLIGCDTAAVKAVTAVESGGAAFAPDGRCIIRFEVHKFWANWGKLNQSTFNQHFKFFKAKPWLQHQAQLPGEIGFTSVHTSQAREWAVYQFAASLDESAAMESISMGMFQILGENYAFTAHNTVQEFFADNCESAASQLNCFAKFCCGYRHLATHLKAHDWRAFATEYNGTGNVDDYAAKLAAHYHL